MSSCASTLKGRRQSGIATILIILITGLSFGALVLGLAYYVRSTQEQGMAMHAQTQAQIKAWTGAEVVRRYLNVLLSNETRAKPGDSNVSFNLHDFAEQFSAQAADAGQAAGSAALPLEGIQGLSARVVSVDDDQGEFVVDIVGETGQGTRAHATSTLRLVYRISGGTPASRNRALTFMRNLRLGGSINVRSDAGTRYEINVKGDVSTGGNSITGVDIINATGSIQIGSGSSFDELHANGDIQLTGSVSGQQNLSSRGNICLSGGASALGTVHAMGSVVGDGGVRFGNISSIGISEGVGEVLCAPVALDANGHAYGVDLQGNSAAQSVTTKGSVRLNSGSIGQLLAQGDLVVSNWGGDTQGRIGGELRNQGNPALSDKITQSAGSNVAVAPVSPVVIDSESFNANSLEAQANYALRIDAAGYKIVTVRNVAGVADGSYFIGDYDNGHPSVGWGRGYKDYLCSTLAAGSTPAAPRCLPDGGVLDPPGTICKGHSNYNNCLSYNASNQRWSLDGTTFAPGVLWVDGNLHVGNGTYFNSFIATGNITTGGSLTVYAPNYAGATGEVAGVRYSPQGMCNNTDFPGRMPTQFCQAGGFDYDASGGMGNYAMAAGSCSNDSCSPYVGGDIELGASNNLHGSVLAGNQFSSGGSTTVHGYISALALGDRTFNSMGGSTTIDLRNLPPGFDPGGGGVGGVPTNRVIQVRWSRYL